LRWLDSFTRDWKRPPTSAELADYGIEDMGAYDGLPFNAFSEIVLYVRRGLSDLQTTGTVSAAGKRVCRVSGRTVETWKVVTR